jgi:hypothetical protein
MAEKYFLRSTCRDMIMSGFTNHCDKDGCSAESITTTEMNNYNNWCCYSCDTSSGKECVCPSRGRTNVVCDCEDGWNDHKSDRCSMCNNGNAKWCDIPWYADFTYFCNHECKSAFCSFIQSGYNDLTHGVPYEINEDHAVFKNNCATSLPVECANCGSRENIVRNLVMFGFGYKHSDFCKNNKCQTNYVNYIKTGNEIPYMFRDK